MGLLVVSNLAYLSMVLLVRDEFSFWNFKMRLLMITPLLQNFETSCAILPSKLGVRTMES